MRYEERVTTLKYCILHRSSPALIRIKIKKKIVPHPPYFLKSFPFTLEVLENSFNVLIYFAFFIVEYINLQSNFYPLSAFTTLIFVK